MTPDPGQPEMTILISSKYTTPEVVDAMNAHLRQKTDEGEEE
ncbi:hypothetical protein [Streptomyces sp. NPDC017941]